MPVDFVLPVMLALALVGGIVGVRLILKKRKGAILGLALFDGLLLIAFWAAYFLPEVRLRSAAVSGDAMAQYQLSHYYRSRLGYLWPDQASARDWMIRAAENGNPYAMAEVGSAYTVDDNWLGVERDLGKARDWLKKAAKAGDRDAPMLLERLDSRATGSAN